MYGVSGSDGSTTVKEGSSQVRRCTTGGAGVGCSEEVPEGDEHIAARALSCLCLCFEALVTAVEPRERAVAMRDMAGCERLECGITAMGDASREGIQ